MNNTKPFAYLLGLACLLFAVSCATTDASKSQATAPGARRDILYVCNCGADCKCKTVATKPGKCGCGMDLKASRAVKVEQTDALLCACDLDCKCTVDPKDATKCGCGKPIRKVSLKGTGIYFCNCGGSCTCNTFSDKPDKCKCGMDLKKAE
jgi:hypothetical protein